MLFFSFVRISELITYNSKGRKKIRLTPAVIVNKVTSANNRLFDLKNLTNLALGNNLVVYLKEVTSTYNRILLEFYSLDSSCLLFATTEICSRTRA